MKVWNWEGFWSYFTNLYLLEGALWTIGLTISTLILGHCRERREGSSDGERDSSRRHISHGDLPDLRPRPTRMRPRR